MDKVYQWISELQQIKTDTETFKTQAQTAKTGAETAKTETETAKTGAKTGFYSKIYMSRHLQSLKQTDRQLALLTTQ